MAARCCICGEKADLWITGRLHDNVCNRCLEILKRKWAAENELRALKYQAPDEVPL